MHPQAIMASVEKILQQADKYQWSLQGFGMLRLHMSHGYRLNVWDSRFRVPNVSMIHTHPWNFVSQVVAGTLRNHRYLRYPYDHKSLFPDIKYPLFESAKIRPGQGGGIMEKTPADFQLCALMPENYIQGDEYRQCADEIHASEPVDGTITLNMRVRVGLDEAFVFWPKGEEWRSAEPRNATTEEVHAITRASLAKWF